MFTPVSNIMSKDHNFPRHFSTFRIESVEHGTTSICVPIDGVIHVPFYVPSKHWGSFIVQSFGQLHSIPNNKNMSSIV